MYWLNVFNNKMDPQMAELVTMSKIERRLWPCKEKDCYWVTTSLNSAFLRKSDFCWPEGPIPLARACSSRTTSLDQRPYAKSHAALAQISPPACPLKTCKAFADACCFSARWVNSQAVWFPKLNFLFIDGVVQFGCFTVAPCKVGFHVGFQRPLVLCIHSHFNSFIMCSYSSRPLIPSLFLRYLHMVVYCSLPSLKECHLLHGTLGLITSVVIYTEAYTFKV